MAEIGKMNKRNLIIIILLMLVSGLLIYYLYLKPEAFAVTTPPQSTRATSSTSPQTTIPSGCPTLPPPIPVAVLSRYFGVGFNIYPANNTTAASINSMTGSNNANTMFLIEHIPVVYNGSVGSMYAVSNGQLTIKLRNDLDPEQWWVFNRASDSSSTYYNITPYNMINTTPQLSLQYENGNLSIRPQNPSFESQKWIFSNTPITRGIPVLNYGPASLFTPEFNPFTSNNMSSTASVSQSNNQQVSDVINFIKTNIQQYLATVGATPEGTIPGVSASSLGNKDMPLNINVNLGSGSTSKSAFDNITGTTTSTDLLSLLDKYETSQTLPASNQLFSGTDLATSLQTNQGCASLNIGDYTSNRVSSCNCKL
jgi:hypothetical protein